MHQHIMYLQERLVFIFTSGKDLLFIHPHITQKPQGIIWVDMCGLGCQRGPLGVFGCTRLKLPYLGICYEPVVPPPLFFSTTQPKHELS